MENKKTLEKILFCVGTIFLFIGLWSFIDFSFMSANMILSIVAILSIGTYFVADKNLFKSKLISNVFATISAGLAMTTLGLFVAIFDVAFLDWIILLISIGLMIFYIYRFNCRPIYIFSLLYCICAGGIALELTLLKEIVCLIPVLGIIYVLQNKYEILKPRKWFVQVYCISLLSFFMSICIEDILTDIFGTSLSFTFFEFEMILISLMLAYRLYFRNQKTHVNTARAYKFMLTYTLFACSITETWETAFSTSFMPFIFAAIATIASLYWHLKGCLEGKKISYVMFGIQCLLILTNVVEDLSASVFVMLLGLLLIVGAIFINKRKSN